MSKKFIYSFCAGLALLGMASCSNDDMVNSPVINADNATGYARVSISFPDVTTTRAAEFGSDYINGEANEQEIKTISLALYDADGSFVGTGTQYSEAPSLNPTQKVDGEEGDNVSNTHSIIFKLNLEEGAKLPTQVIAFINTPIQTGSIAQLESGYPINVDKDFVANSSTGFPMTNSGYYSDDSNGGAWNMAAAFTYDNVKDTPEEVQGEAGGAAAPLAATIRVERLAAKVTLKKNEVEQAPNYKVYDVAGEEVTLEYDPSNWSVTGWNKKENVVKSKFDYNSLFTGWNKATDYRSFWAQGATWDEGFSSYYSNGAVAENSPLDYIKFGQIQNPDGSFNLTAVNSPEYAPEHTTMLGGDNENLLANTYAIVVGKYAVNSTNHSDWFVDSEGNADFYLLLAGSDGDIKTYTAYNKAQLIAYLLKNNDVATVSTTANGDAVKTDLSDATSQEFEFDKYFDLEYGDDGKYVLANVEGQTLYSGETVLDADNLTKTTASRHYYFPEGAAYFNVPLVHANGTNKTFYGLVRNHAYNLTITKIENLGAPLNGDQFGENDPVVPDIDELKDHFINATIEILSWHEVVDNNVIL